MLKVDNKEMAIAVLNRMVWTEHEIGDDYYGVLCGALIFLTEGWDEGFENYIYDIRNHGNEVENDALDFVLGLL